MLGILEKVEVNTPAEWCCRMVCVPKKTRKHRRTVDLQPLNRATLRQCFTLALSQVSNSQHREECL